MPAIAEPCFVQGKADEEKDPLEFFPGISGRRCRFPGETALTLRAGRLPASRKPTHQTHGGAQAAREAAKRLRPASTRVPQEWAGQKCLA